MSSWERCNKVSGVYWPRVPPQELSIKLQLRQTNGVVPLPKYEDFVSSTDTSNLQNLEVNTEEYTFKWQEKLFSAWELQEYEDSHNCRTEQTRRYHIAITNQENNKDSKVFTYVNDDNYESEAMTTSRSSKNHIQSMGRLGTCLERLQLAEGTTEDQQGLLEVPRLSNLGHKSVCRRDLESENWVGMHIMMDKSEQPSKTELVLKNEVLLASLFWNSSSGCLIVHPDVNFLDANPYMVETTTGRYHYAMELRWKEPSHQAIEARAELLQMVKKLKRKWQHRNRHLLNFSLPPPATRRYFLTLEILSAVDFEDDNIYIEFEVRPPPESRCKEKIEGRTHIARAHATREGPVANYSHLLEFELDYDDCGSEERLHAEPRLFVEVISVDRWRRERTQGAAHCALPLRPPAPSPAAAALRLPCARPLPAGAAGESRRFFLGGARLLDDVSWLHVPAGHRGPTLNKFGVRCVGTGAVTVRARAVSQALRGGGAGRAGQGEERGQGGGGGGGALFRSVDAVLREYRRARQRLDACRDDIHMAAGPSSSST